MPSSLITDGDFGGENGTVGVEDLDSLESESVLLSKSNRTDLLLRVLRRNDEKISKTLIRAQSRQNKHVLTCSSSFLTLSLSYPSLLGLSFFTFAVHF